MAESIVQTSASSNVPAKPKAEKSRLHVLDNVKFVLSILVALEHLNGPSFAEGRETFRGALSLGMKMFLMPTWTFISGYCSSTDLSNIRKLDGCIKVLAIYILSQLFWLLMSRYADPWYATTKWGMELRQNGLIFTKERTVVEDFLVPFWQLWYLRDLAVWRIVLPFWARLRYPLITSWLVSASIKAFYLYDGVYDQGNMSTWLNLKLVWMYFPLYYLGTVAKERKLQVRRGIWYRVAGAVVLVVSILIPVFEPPDMTSLWRFEGHSDTVAHLTGMDFVDAVLHFFVVLLAYLFIVVAIAAVFHVAPQERIPVMTDLGERSLVNYIFHPLSGMLLSYTGAYGGNYQGSEPPAWGAPAIFIFAILQGMFWMSPWAWHIVWPICDPPIHWVLKPQTAGAPTGPDCSWFEAFVSHCRKLLGRAEDEEDTVEGEETVSESDNSAASTAEEGRRESAADRQELLVSDSR
eukprot:TRINITY_DN8834_c0_g1_i1.p1 TRINITY_DN8834_c0_g1~~TRINITY_DN8834_c0_g1_i1.p1  ORF type:complete len:474 (-),score=54.00 TRINITY_DN8834_c0_g1_i1:422-1813(-)